MGLFGKKEAPEVDLSRAQERAEKKELPVKPDPKLKLLGTIVYEMKERESALEAKDSVSSLMLEYASTQPEQLEKHVLKLYMGIDPEDDRKTLKSFRTEVVYLTKKAKKMRKGVKKMKISDEEKEFRRESLDKVVRVLKKVKKYVEHLLELDDKERANLFEVDEDDLTGEQKDVLEDRGDVEKRLKKLGEQVADPKERHEELEKVAEAA